MVFDEEGRRLPNQNISWNVDLGTIVSSDSVTNCVGEAYCVVRSTTNHETATVWAETGSIGAGCYVEYANEGDPYIIITSPTGGDVSGFVAVQVITFNSDGGTPDTQLFVDGTPKGSITTNEYRLSGLDTCQLTNGWHILKARATDDSHNTMWSQEVSIYVDNEVSSLDYSSEIFTDEPNQGPITLSAYMNSSGTWSTEIRNCKDDSVAYTTSGTGPGPISLSWDGKISGTYIPGIYKITVSAQPTGDSPPTTRDYNITISQANASTLICGKLRGDEDWSRETSVDEMIAVADACRARGVTYTLVADPLWVYDDDAHYPYGEDPNQGHRLRLGFKAWINKGFHNFFYSTHGKTQYKNGKWRSSILFDTTGDQAYVYGTDYDWPLSERFAIAAFSDCGINPDQYRIVHINACWSWGNYLHGVDTSLPNAFGNYGYVENDQTYIGWSFYYYPTGTPLSDGLSPNGTMWTKEFWRQLGMGYTVYQADQRTLTSGNYHGWMHYLLGTYGGDMVTFLDSW
jgi:hypothetical protein